MPAASGLYDGTVVHRRLRPAAHGLRYRLFWMLLDLDELDRPLARLRLFSRNRFNLFGFTDRDHLDGSATPLRTQVERAMQLAGVEPDGGPIRLLCVPRILGYAFNPLSVYFCHRRDGSVAAVLYEVNNTFGQRHCYVIAAEPAPDGTIEQHCAKRFYVSPFMDMDLTYRFRVRPPAETTTVAVDAHDREGLLIATAFAGRRLPLTDATLLRMAAAHPLMMLKVVAAIHWEALKIWRKGVGLKSRPPLPPGPVTVGRSGRDPSVSGRGATGSQ